MKLEFGSFTNMKRTALLCFCGAAVALGQQAPQTLPNGFFTTLPVTTSVGQNSPLTSPSPLPTWNYTFVAKDANTYTTTIVGRSPFSHGKTTTTIPTQLIPLVITINDGNTTVTYDPTVLDPCVSPATHTDIDIIEGSPIFVAPAAPWTMSGVNVGATQYIDGFQRAEFWSLVAGTPYHLILNRSTLAGTALSFNSTQATNYVANGCGNIGIVNIDEFNNAVKGLITGALSGLINTGTFPIFLTHNVFEAQTGHSINVACCILGFHSAIAVGAQFQIYSPFSLNTTQAGPINLGTLAHEMGEAINDPYVNNTAPAWGNIGQVQPSPPCYPLFEVGDPLSPGFPLGPHETAFTVPAANGLTYTLQEMAYFSWFYGGTNLGTPGFFSNNSTFTGFAKACPPGGTN